jgi:hypothetical protein
MIWAAEWTRIAADQVRLLVTPDPMNWKRILAIVAVAEALTLATSFVLPILEHRIFLHPRFPNVIVFHHSLPSCIVDFQGSVLTFGATSTLFWLVVAVALASLIMFIRRDEARVNAYIALHRSRDLNQTATSHHLE